MMIIMENQKYISVKDWSISLILGLAVWIFFGVFYRHHLHYHEQLQLFLNTSEYLMELTSRPGGLASYISSFFIQFFYSAMTGAFLFALLLVLLQRLVLDAANHIARKPMYSLLTCLPSIGYAILFCDENFLLSGLIALLFSMIAVAFYNRIRESSFRLIYIVAMTPLLYWLVGLGSAVFVLSALLAEWVRKEKINRGLLTGVTLLSIFIWILCPYMAKVIVPQFPINRFWLAGDYSRFVLQLYGIYLLVMVFTIFIPLLFRWLPDKKEKKVRYLYEGIQFVFITTLSVVGIAGASDWNKEEVMAYDYYSRTQKWNTIVNIADREPPQGPLTVSTLNFALSKAGYMPDYMFTYFQNGPEGLLPNFQKDFMVSVMTGEIYYHLGLINIAQQFAFEAMEAIPGYKKSVRCMKRLAETNLINGQYAVAAKYLNILQHTFAYKTWAEETMTYLGDEERINAHPEWGNLRKLRPQDDFLFSESEKDQMIGVLFQHNPENYMAFEYLLAYTLLTKDLQHFFQYYGLGEGKLTYRVIPRSYQEAMALIWSGSGNTQQPALIDNGIIERLRAFQTIQKNQANAEVLLRDQFEDTYWYYFYYRRK